MDDGSIKNDGLMQGPIIGGHGHYITQHYYASDSKSTPPERAWNVPYQRNPYFTGREDLMVRLHQQLHAGQDIALSQAISGLGGVGKTQLAVEYAYRYREEYRYILWVRAESEESLISSYVTLAHLLNLPQKDVQDQHITIQAIKHWLQNNSGWLLILDNADEPKIIPLYIPAAPQGHCLYTTRAFTLGRLAHCLEVESFSDEQGALFLLRRAQILSPDVALEQAYEHERELALQITRELGGLPLALDQAGAYIDEAQTNLAEYFHLYQRRRAELLNERGEIAPDHPEPVATTWSLSFERVAQRNPAAADLLRLLAFLAPDDIPEEIITGGAEYLGETLAPVASDPFNLDKPLRALLAYSLIKRDREQKALSIHRLVQAVLQDIMPTEERRQWMECAIFAVGKTFRDPSCFEQWEFCERWLPHLQLCVSWAVQEKIETPEVAYVFHQLAYYLSEKGQYSEAESLYDRALAIDERVLGTEHPQVATCLNNLASLYHQQGKYEEAEQLYKRILEIDEKNLGAGYSLTELNLNNLGLLYQYQGKYEEAEQLYKQELEIREKEFGVDHPRTAKSLNNLGSLYQHQGKFEEAESLLRRALTICEGGLGTNHPDTGSTMGNLGLLYQYQGKYKEAEPLLKRALKICVQELGVEHPYTAASLNNLALLYQNQGKYEAAKTLLKRALEISERSLGARHPETQKTWENYISLLQAMSQNIISGQVLVQEKLHGKQKKKARQRENRLK
ncbi:tetratricopeptide repeat protein [Ktedonobacter sp. SOSP1-85]|uniref:FxSxx-COOH system tetratricopeptide repeat protein n=1 Tax=Ktedonobacter sp. SOSP1-85 TaxID=2778367 RepID=UPI0019151983|nr:FxSxx-COOH system tetratricopeptide repeat protein [Ktedonobacter sp. SOSP1-85]GHO76463.1 tetratricopeptide repeat protein [Ktedonobacter sp. SOSP1-85]